MNKDTIKKYGAILLILFSLLAGILIFFQIVIDDAFIFFKYGYNLVHHGVWSWSTEGKPVEAYTSFIYAIFSIFPYLLHIPPHVFIKLVGLALLLILIYRVYKKTASFKIALFAILIIVTNWQVYVHAFSGLETILWCWLLLESFFILKAEDVTAKKQWWLWSICLLMALTRPEGAIYAFFYLVYLQFYRKVKINYAAIAVVAIIGVVYFVWRFMYFGLLFPLPFYHKVMDNQFGKFAFIFNMYTSWYYLICAGLVFYFFRKSKLLFFLGMVSFLVFFGLYGKSFLVMNFADRFPFQLFFPFILFAIIELENSSHLDKVKIILIAGFLNLIILSKGLYDENFIELASVTNNAGSAFFVPRSHYLLAKNINKIKDIDKKQIHVLFGDAGVFPHYVKAKCYDYNGLTDAYFATHKLTNAYFDKANADVVLIGFPSADKEKLSYDWTNCKLIYNMVDKNSNFTYLGYTICKENGYYVHIYLRNNSVYHDDLNTALTTAIKESADATFKIKRFLKFKYLDMDNI